MWLTIGRGALEVRFTHTHRMRAEGEAQPHRHDALVATVEAHELAHRLGSYGELTP